MDAASLHTAVQRADRARLIRFVTYVDRGRQSWKGPVEEDTDAQLRATAFVLADHWRVVRRENRLWRGYYDRHPVRQLIAA